MQREFRGRSIAEVATLAVGRRAPCLKQDVCADLNRRKDQLTSRLSGLQRDLEGLRSDLSNARREFRDEMRPVAGAAFNAVASAIVALIAAGSRASTIAKILAMQAAGNAALSAENAIDALAAHREAQSFRRRIASTRREIESLTEELEFLHDEAERRGCGDRV